MSQVRTDLIAFLTASRARKEHIHIGPYFCSHCLEPRDLKNQRYCGACRRLYRRKRQLSDVLSVLFHDDWRDLAAHVCATAT